MSYERLTKKAGFHKDIDLKNELGYSYIYQRLSELENQIENGTLIDITEKFIIEEEIKNKTRYLICEHYLTKMIVDFADNKAEAEKKLKELQNDTTRNG